jgi:alpha-1,2-mannosyltransferase
MRAEVGVTSTHPAGERDQAGGRGLLIAGVAVAAVAAVAYLLAVAAHPMNAMLKGFDLKVYLGGAHEALHHPADLYTWSYQGHQSIKFTYPPFSALLFAPGNLLSFKALMAIVTAVSVFALIATVWIAFRELGWQGSARLGATLLLSGLLLWSEPVQRALFLGQVEPVLMALVVWDLCQPDRRPWKGTLTGIAAGIKLVPLLFIVYLLVTKRFKQAAVAAAAFAVTVIIGFIALPRASTDWWLRGDFWTAGRTGFVGDQQNQSLRGMLTRLIGSVNGAYAAWLVLAVLVVVAGLAAAVVLHRSGRTFAGLMAVALTALLVSPISWDHHWVWIAPGLALIADTAVNAIRQGKDGGKARAGALWLALAVGVLLVFAAWPDFWAPKKGLLQGGLINYAPASSFASGDNPAFAEYHWHGLQLIAGNLELLAGLALFIIVFATAYRCYRVTRITKPSHTN